MAITDYRDWRDFPSDPDLSLTPISGLEVLRQALARRLSTPRGGLWYDPSYGHDLRLYLHSVFDAATRYDLAVGVEAEVLKDPRILSSKASLAAVEEDTFEVAIDAITTGGPWSLIVRVSDAGVEVLGG